VLRLSIVIPALGNDAALESGLVSVLEHRPPSSEVIVVFNSDYADPYHLRDELRFVDAAPGAGPLECLAAGYRESRGEIVHFLAAGLEVKSGWAEAALGHFADPAVATVSPLLLAPSAAGERVAAAGWGYQRGGKAYELAANLPAADAAAHAALLVGPTRLAGFFRREALAPLAGLAELGVGDELAFVGLALRLRAAGYQARLAADSLIAAPNGTVPGAERGFRQALRLECLFWRYAGLLGWAGSLAAHCAVLAAELCEAIVRPRLWPTLAGRAVGLTAMLGLRRQNDSLLQPAEEPVAHPIGGAQQFRMDKRHAASSPAPACGTAPSRRSA
jgi:hypothetical protein